jgi:hypothetical protein
VDWEYQRTVAAKCYPLLVFIFQFGVSALTDWSEPGVANQRRVLFDNVVDQREVCCGLLIRKKNVLADNVFDQRESEVNSSGAGESN